MIIISRFILSVLFLFLIYNYSFALVPNIDGTFYGKDEHLQVATDLYDLSGDSNYKEFRGRSIDYLNSLNDDEEISEIIFEIKSIAGDLKVKLYGEDMDTFISNAIEKGIITSREGSIANEFYAKYMYKMSRAEFIKKTMSDLSLYSAVGGKVVDQKIIYQSVGAPLAVLIVMIGGLEILENNYKISYLKL